MNAPRRWKDTPDAPVGVRELLSAGRQPRAIDGATLDRGALRVAKLGAAPAAAAAGVAVGLWTKLAAAAVIGMAGVGAVVAVRHVEAVEAERGMAARAEAEAEAKADVEAKANAEARANAEAKAQVNAEAKAPASAEASTRAVVSRAARAVAPVAGPGRVEAAVVTPGGIDGATIGDELALLEQARAALARDPGASLARVAQHRARFPAGALGAERDLIELDALRRSGRAGEVRSRARAWLEREPQGLYAARMRAILATLDRGE